MGVRLGADVALDALRRGSMRCSGESAPRPREGWSAPARNSRCRPSRSRARGRGRRDDIGDDVLVIGGGNTAMDASRTAVRFGARRVRVLYRRSRREMPCLMAEVEAAEAEGVAVETLVAPVRLERSPAAGSS